MFRKTRICALLVALTLMAVCVPLLGADDGDAPATVPVPHIGYFEQHYVITEVVMTPVFVVVFILLVAFGSQDTTITTRHTDFWGKPIGYSYTKLPIPQEPMEPGDMRRILTILYVVYLFLRISCMSGLLTGFWQECGRALDATLGR